MGGQPGLQENHLKSVHQAKALPVDLRLSPAKWLG
jgi:hypothetical protein